MDNNTLFFRNSIVFVVGFIMFVVTLFVGFAVHQSIDAKSLQNCVSAGGSWDNSTGDCVLPDAPLEG